MAMCNWDPTKHEGKPCPIHGESGNGQEAKKMRKAKYEANKSGRAFDERFVEENKEKYDWKDIDAVKSHVAPFDSENGLEEISDEEIDNFLFEHGLTRNEIDDLENDEFIALAKELAEEKKVDFNTAEEALVR